MPGYREYRAATPAAWPNAPTVSARLPPPPIGPPARLPRAELGGLRRFVLFVRHLLLFGQLGVALVVALVADEHALAALGVRPDELQLALVLDGDDLVL